MVDKNNKTLTREEFIDYLTKQKAEMERYKWIESEKRGIDLGNEAIQEWINKYAKTFRDNYEVE